MAGMKFFMTGGFLMKLYNRAKLSKSEKSQVKRNYNKNNQEIDPNTKQPLKEGKIDYGHKYGYEEHAMQKYAKQEGFTQKQYNKLMKNPDLYQREDSHENRSRKHECKNKTLQYMKCKSYINEFKVKNKDLMKNTSDKNSKTHSLKGAKTYSGRGTFYIKNVSESSGKSNFSSKSGSSSSSGKSGISSSVGRSGNSSSGASRSGGKSLGGNRGK